MTLHLFDDINYATGEYVERYNEHTYDMILDIVRYALGLKANINEHHEAIINKLNLRRGQAYDYYVVQILTQSENQVVAPDWLYSCNVLYKVRDYLERR